MSSRSSAPLLAVDGDNLLHRAYHALPASMRDAEGRPANALTGFADALASLWNEIRPRAVFVAFDTPTQPTYRHALLATYQSGRDFTENAELMQQLERAPELVTALGIAWAKGAGYEADDFLAAAVREEEWRGGTAVVVSSDRDLFQLASERTTIVLPRGGGGRERVGPREVRERYGVEPAQVPDFVALRGDPSDRIPGAPGIGPAKAAALLGTYGSLEAALAAGRFPAEAETLRAYRAIATLQADAPLPELPDQVPDWTSGAAFAERLGLGGLARRLRARAATTAPPPPRAA